jgi:hypothetical protein
MTATLIFSDCLHLHWALSVIVYSELNDKYEFNFSFEENGKELFITTFNTVSHLEMQNLCDDLHLEFSEHDLEFIDFTIN